MKRFILVLPLVFAGCFVGLVHSGQAQTPAMSLVGSVQSDAQAPLRGAAITVIHMPSGARHAAASDGEGRFALTNLAAGGPYIIKVGEGGYRSQTVENIFLETGKTANVTVTLSKIGGASGKNRANRAAEQAEETLALAPEAVVGGPVLITTLSKPQSRSAAAAAAPARTVPAPNPAPVAPPTAAQAEPPAAAPAVPYARYPARRYTRRPITRVADPIVPGHYDAKSGNYIYDTGQLITLRLVNGSVISGVGAYSTESYLHRFLADPQVQVDTIDLTRGWYNFDRVYFETGKASLTPESIGQLRNIATILHAYPTARIKLGGYTDSTGTYKVNKLLSEARARTAWASLVEMGVSPSRMDARGYGPNYAISANATEEGRAKNRRLSVKVLQK